MQAVIRTRERELRCALEEALSARQEVEAKTAQVKEYKAQVRTWKCKRKYHLYDYTIHQWAGYLRLWVHRGN